MNLFKGIGKAHKRLKGLGIGLAFIAVFVCACLMYLSGGIGVYRPDPTKRDEIERNVQTLYALEHAPVEDLNEAARIQYREKLNKVGGVLVDDIYAEQQKIVALEEWSKSDIVRWFSDAAIIGDSIVLDIAHYKWLGEPPVFGKQGGRAVSDLDILDDVEKAEPSVIFLCFGMNDMDSYGAKVSSFTSRYAALIERLKRNLPNAIIYVNAVFPVTDEAIVKDENYRHVDLYNEGLRSICPELGVYYIDSGFILRQRPELFEKDGAHMRKNFYPRWLTYLADISGLSDNDE